MKKALIIIIAIFSLFSIENNAFANTYSQKWLIENLLNLDYGPIKYELELQSLDNYTFRDNSLKKIYSDLLSYDTIVRKEIIYSHQKWIFDYYTTNGIVKNYSLFISYTNDFFYYLSLIDKNPKLEYNLEIQDAVLSTYKNSKIYYKKVQSLISKNK